MSRHILFMLAVCLTAGCRNGDGTTSPAPTDWKLSRGDAALSGHTSTPLPDKPELLWTYKGETRTVSSPVVSDGITYWSDRRGLVRGVDMEGRLTFSYDMQTAVEATPVISDSILYIGRIDGFMVAISLARQDTIWTFETLGQISASPNVTRFAGRQAVVFGSYDNNMYCVDALTGEELSRFASGYYLNGAAAIWQEHAIFGGCDSWLRIIDCRTGERTDSLLLDSYIPSSPAIRDNLCYVGDHSGNIYKLTLENGKISSHKKVNSAVNDKGSFVAAPAISDQVACFFEGDRYLHTISMNDETLWKYMLRGNVGESSPVICLDKVIACTKTGIVSIIDAANGTLLWEYDTGEQIAGSPAIIKDRFMILTAKGTLLCFGKVGRS